MKIIRCPSNRNTNGSNLVINSEIRLTVQTGDISVDVEFSACDTLSVPSILGRRFITPHVDAIRPGKRRVVFIDEGHPKGDTAIIKNRTLNGSQDIVAEAYGREQKSVTGVAKRVRLPRMSESVVLVRSDLTGLSRLRSNIRLHARLGLTMASGIIDMPPSGRFLSVIANYRKTEIFLPKNVKDGMAERYEGDILGTDKEGGI